MFKKTTLLIAACFALGACSEDIYQENGTYNSYDEYSESNHSDNIKPFTDVDKYLSPWQFDWFGKEVKYYLYSPLSNYNTIIRVTPYIGLAYYDGVDDGDYHTPGITYNLNNGNYPTLYNNNQEYGNYIAANPIVLNGVWSMGAASTQQVAIQGGGHCPVFTADVFPFNPHGIYYDVINNHLVQPQSVSDLAGVTVPVAASATIHEAMLLNYFGKVMYYKVEFGDSPTNYLHTFYVLSLEPESFADPSWDPTSIGIDDFGGEMYYNTSSQEIVVDPDGVFSNIDFKKTNGYTGTIGGNANIAPLIGGGSLEPNQAIIRAFYGQPVPSPDFVWLYIEEGD